MTQRLAALAVQQERDSTRAKGERKQELRLANQLRNHHIKPLQKMAVAYKAELPRLGKIAFPWRRSNATVVAQHGRSAVKMVRPFAPVFAKRHRPDFIARMLTAIEALEEATLAKGAAKGGRIRATTAITKTIGEARQVVSAVDAIIGAQLPEHDPILTEWRLLVKAFRRATAVGG